MPGMKHVGFDTLHPRETSLMDLAALSKLGGDAVALVASAKRTGDWSAIISSMDGVFVDLSQNPCRQPWTNFSTNVSKCLTTGSSLYSFAKQRLVLPVELLYFQGHPRTITLPDGMSNRSATALAGEGIALPCLGSLVYGLLCTGCMPGMQ